MIWSTKKIVKSWFSKSWISPEDTLAHHLVMLHKVYLLILWNNIFCSQRLWFNPLQNLWYPPLSSSCYQPDWSLQKTLQTLLYTFLLSLVSIAVLEHLWTNLRPEPTIKTPTNIEHHIIIKKTMKGHHIIVKKNNERKGESFG